MFPEDRFVKQTSYPLIWDEVTLVTKMSPSHVREEGEGGMGPFLDFTFGKYDILQGVFSTSPALKVLSIELVPPNKEIDWFRQKTSKYGILVLICQCFKPFE